VTSPGAWRLTAAGPTRKGAIVRPVLRKPRRIGLVVLALPSNAPVGFVPLGRHQGSNQRIRWNLKVNGHALPDGTYEVYLNVFTRPGKPANLPGPKPKRLVIHNGTGQAVAREVARPTISRGIPSTRRPSNRPRTTRTVPPADRSRRDVLWSPEGSRRRTRRAPATRGMEGAALARLARRQSPPRPRKRDSGAGAGSAPHAAQWGTRARWHEKPAGWRRQVSPLSSASSSRRARLGASCSVGLYCSVPKRPMPVKIPLRESTHLTTLPIAGSWPRRPIAAAPQDARSAVVRDGVSLP
jgi:hypothetical protein